MGTAAIVIPVLTDLDTSTRDFIKCLIHWSSLGRFVCVFACFDPLPFVRFSGRLAGDRFEWLSELGRDVALSATDPGPAGSNPFYMRRRAAFVCCVRGASACTPSAGCFDDELGNWRFQ